MTNHKRLVLNTLMVGTLGLASAAGYADESTRTGPVRDAWIDGRLETAYLFNPHLNPFTIGTDVVDGKVTLTGHVSSDIDRDLAQEVARGIDGVAEVDNQLEVKAKADSPGQPETTGGFRQIVTDATTTAVVKTKLAANDNTDALQIEVSTKQDVVTLSGAVESSEEKALAELLARNTSGVRSVVNELRVERGVNDAQS